MIKFDTKELDQAFKSLNKKINDLKKSISNGFKEIEDKSTKLLNTNINNAYQDYYDYQDNDTSLDGYKNDIIINKKDSNNEFEIEYNIGSNSLVATKNNNIVNIYYFLCFGYGYVGEYNSLVSSSTFNWDYDINEHGEEGWNYLSVDGIYKHTMGIIGYDFITPINVFFTSQAKNIIIENIEKGIKK